MTRFAPSPTGHLHIGGARTALFCWAFARAHAQLGGRFMIRIEDTDQARSSESSARGILQDLAWLGIEWDDGPELQVGLDPHHRDGRTGPRTIGGDARRVGPYYQSQRLDIYNRVCDELIASGRGYADFTPAAEIEAQRKAATARKETFRYRPADSAILPVAEQRRRMAAGEPHVVRVRAPVEPVVVVDQVLGEVRFAAGEVDDFVLRKADGFPTYHFGVVVDDELMGVTHVLRGQEHLMNTPRHVLLQKVLGYRTPVYAHMPLIFNDQGAKMSKRERDQAARAAVKKAGLTSAPVGAGGGAPVLPRETFSAWLADSKRQLESQQLEALAAAMNPPLTLPEVSVDDFRSAGYLPEVICNFIALLGWNPGMKDDAGKEVEKFDLAFLAAHFAIDRIGKTNARFDRKKLLAFNTDAMTKLAPADFAARFRAWCADHAPRITRAIDGERWVFLCAALQPRSKTFRDAADRAAFALVPDEAVVFDPAAVKQHIASRLELKGEGVAPGSSVLGSDVVREIGAVLAGLPALEPAEIHRALEAFAAGRGLTMAQVSQVVRVAATGGTVSPPIDLTLAVLGREGVGRRFARCLSAVG
ncbi:MAG: glutamate--tRNA ligase [Phycisphaerales bacterium]